MSLIIKEIGPFSREEETGEYPHPTGWATEGHGEDSDDGFWLCNEELVNLFPQVKEALTFTICFWDSRVENCLEVSRTGFAECGTCLFLETEEGSIPVRVNPEWTEISLKFPWYATLEVLTHVNSG